MYHCEVLDMSDKTLSELEYMSVEIWHTDTKKRMKTMEENIQRLLGSYKMCNISIILIPEEEREKGAKRNI